MDEKKLNILFLGGGKRVSVAEHFQEKGNENFIKINIFSYELNSEVPIVEVATIIEGKNWNECITHLLEIIEKFSVDIVIPFVDPATLIATELKLARPDIFIPVSDKKVCECFISKIETNVWCNENNIPTPVSIPNLFPKIAKPDKGSASKGLIIINNESELQNLAKPENYLVQQFITAIEYTVDAYRSLSHGNINYLVPRIRLEMQGGEVIKSQTVKNDSIDILTRLIIEKADLYGAITLQFLEDKVTGHLYFLEVNPRFGGGVVTSLGAGIDIFKIILADMEGERLEELDNWKKGLLMVRRFKELFIYANNN